MLKNWSGGRAKRCRWRSPAVHRGAAIFVAAAFAPVAAAVVVWKSSERDVPVATDHGLAVSLVVPDVVYRTAPFEIIVVVDNLADNAVEITVFHRDNSLEPPMLASIINGSGVSLLPVLPEGVAVQGGFIGKPFRHAYKFELAAVSRSAPRSTGETTPTGSTESSPGATSSLCTLAMSWVPTHRLAR